MPRFRTAEGFKECGWMVRGPGRTTMGTACGRLGASTEESPGWLKVEAERESDLALGA